MSSGSDSDVVIDVRVGGSGAVDGGTSGTGGAGGAGGGSDEGLVPDQDFKKVAAWKQASDISATESVIARSIRWLPFVNADMASNVAQGLTSGYYARSIREGITAGGQLTGSTAGQFGGAIGGAAGQVAGSVGPMLPSAGGAIAGLGMAAAGAAATIAGLEVASRAFGRALDGFTRSIEGSAVLQSLRLREQTQIQMQREMRALAAAPMASSLIDTQTRRQVELEQLSGSISLALARVLQPFAEYLNLILEILNDTLGPALELIADLATQMLWLVRMQVRVWSSVWNWIKERFGFGDAEVNPGEHWMKALDPNADANQPLGNDEVDAGLFNPRGGKLNR